MPSSIIRGRYLISRAGADADSSVVISDGALFQRDGVIEDVGRYEDLKARYETDDVIGGPNHIVFPGLVNCHHHGRGVSTFQLGSCDDALEMWTLSGLGRRPVDNYLMTLYTALQMIESGTTTVMYNHVQSPTATLEEDVAQILKAFADAGMRTAFSIYLRNQNRLVYDADEQFLSGLPADLADRLRRYLASIYLSDDEYFALFEANHRTYGTDPSSRVRVLLSPSNVQWCSDEFLQRTKEYASRYQTGIHMHLVETIYQREYGRRKWNLTPAAHLGELGFLGPELSCAHAVWLTEGDIELLADTGTTVCHNASSNLRLKSGIAPVNGMLARGMNVAVGTDSTALNDDDDMLQEVRLVSKLHRQPGVGAPTISSHQVLRMATIGGAAPTTFHDIGALEKGRRADAVLLDMRSMEDPYLDGDLDIVDALMYRGKSKDVDAVVIDGVPVLRDGKFAGVDKEEVAKEIRDRLSGPTEVSVTENRQMLQRLLPHMRRFYEGWHPVGGESHYLSNSRW